MPQVLWQHWHRSPMPHWHQRINIYMDRITVWITWWDIITRVTRLVKCCYLLSYKKTFHKYFAKCHSTHIQYVENDPCLNSSNITIVIKKPFNVYFLLSYCTLTTMIILIFTLYIFFVFAISRTSWSLNGPSSGNNSSCSGGFPTSGFRNRSPRIGSFCRTFQTTTHKIR